MSGSLLPDVVRDSLRLVHNGYHGRVGQAGHVNHAAISRIGQHADVLGGDDRIGLGVGANRVGNVMCWLSMVRPSSTVARVPLTQKTITNSVARATYRTMYSVAITDNACLRTFDDRARVFACMTRAPCPE